MMDERSGQEFVGRKRYQRPSTFYETFMAEQEVPVFGGIGVDDMRKLPLAPWRRMGGRGSFIQLDGTGGGNGMYLVEIPAGGALNPERHIYEEIFCVIEGRGTTEVWQEGSTRKQTFEWQAGSLFSPPLNTWHRLVNAASSPALLLAATNAPAVMDTFRNRSFIFDNSFDFLDRYDARDDYFKANEENQPDPVTGRYNRRSNLLPDIINTEVPFDGQRGVGHRRVAPRLAGNVFNLFVAEYPGGNYSKCHRHGGGAVLLCLRGKGYTITWPQELGIRPWEAGNGAGVKRQEYVPGGIVSAAPGDSEWFHGHFPISKEPMRVLAFLGGGGGRRLQGSPGDEVTWNLDVNEGGNTIEYRDEDPQIRRDYREALKQEGAEFRMPEAVYA